MNIDPTSWHFKCLTTSQQQTILSKEPTLIGSYIRAKKQRVCPYMKVQVQTETESGVY